MQDLRMAIGAGLTAWCALMAACTGGSKRPLGASCSSDAQCGSGLCLEGTCVDPLGDEDSDGVLNFTE
ncbi:MAG: hypothetical protein KC492_10345, partial [Myxococcales bacterium]|nr:hypothetical protein [Myxococcales bacterium]